MTTLVQALTTVRHSPGRTFLTALGAALGIATIVALLAVGNGAQRSAGDFVHLGASDLALFQKDTADPTTSVLPESLIPALRRTPGIADTASLVLLVDDIRQDPGAIVFGAQPNNWYTGRLVFSSGHMFTSANQIVVGDQLAGQLHLAVGDQLKVHGRSFQVAGIYHIGIAYQDSGAFMSLGVAQAILGRQGETTLIPIKLAVGTRPAAVERTIRQRFPGISVIGTPQEAARLGANGQLISNAALVIAVLALILGGIGVLNTMMMAVIERKSEFALLSAVGWSGPQIAVRVIMEGVVTTIIGAALGLLLGVIGAHFLVIALGAQQFVTPQVTAWDLGRALLVGVLIGVLGGLYPAWRAAHLSPAQILAQR